MLVKKKKLSKILFYAIVTIIAVLAYLPLNPGLYPYAGRDSSAFALVAKGMLSGKFPYLDLWDHKPPMIYFVNFIGLLLSPNSFWGIYIIQVLFFVISVLMLIRISQRKLNFLSLFFLAVFFVQMNIRLSSGGNSTSFYPQVFQLGLIYLAIQIQFDTCNQKKFILIGSFAAIVLLFRQTSLGVFAAWLIIDLITNGIRKPETWIKNTGLWLFIGFVLVALPVSVFLLLSNSFNHFVDQAFIFNKYYIEDRTRQEFIEAAFSHIRALTNSGILPFAILGIGTIIWRKISKRQIEYIDYLLILSFTFDWLLLFSGGRPREMYELALLPTLILLGYRLLFYLSNSNINKYLNRALIIIACAFVSFRLYGDFVFTMSQGKNLVTEKTRVISFIQNNSLPSDSILVWGAESWVYFYTNRLPPTKYFYQYPLFYDKYACPSKVEEFYSDVLANKPKIIVGTISKGRITDGFGNCKTPKTEQVAENIRSIYSPVEQVGDWTIYQLKE